MLDLADDEVVGVEVTLAPVEVVVVGDGVGTKFQAYGDVAELLVQGAVLIHEVEADGHLHVLLGQLHDATGALHEVGRLAGLLLAEVVALYLHATVEAEDLVG